MVFFIQGRKWDTFMKTTGGVSSFAPLDKMPWIMLLHTRGVPESPCGQEGKYGIGLFLVMVFEPLSGGCDYEMRAGQAWLPPSDQWL